VVESAEVLGQRVVELSFQSRQNSELVPDELTRLAVAFNAKRRHDAVEIGFLTTSPVPATSANTAAAQTHHSKQPKS